MGDWVEEAMELVEELISAETWLVALTQTAGSAPSDKQVRQAEDDIAEARRHLMKYLSKAKPSQGDEK